MSSPNANGTPRVKRKLFTGQTFNSAEELSGSSRKCFSNKDTFRRVTRNSIKEWQQMSDHSNTPTTSGSKPETFTMQPPTPVVQSRYNFSGVVTRRKYNSMVHGTQEKELSQNLKGLNLSSDQASITSDYGTGSEDSKTCSRSSSHTYKSPPSSCETGSYCESSSGMEICQSEESSLLPIEEECRINPVNLSNTNWDSDSYEADISCLPTWENDAESEHNRYTAPDITFLHAGEVTAIVPTKNMKHESKFRISLKTEIDTDLYRQGLSQGLRIHHISPIVIMEPHGTKFHNSFPALLVVPLDVEPQDETWLSCLCSSTSDGQRPKWKRLPKKYFRYSFRHGSLVILIKHFSLFTVILEEPFPEVMKTIRHRSGGRLRLVDVPGVEVQFPKGCLDADIDAFLRVLYDTDPYLNEDREDQHHLALASPIIMLGPHGYEFNTSREPVQIMLPIPDYDNIIVTFGSRAKLSVWQSSTKEGEPMVWEQVNVPIYINKNSSGLPVAIARFSVHHFSFFKLVWDILSNSLYEAKMGMSYFYPYISFSMMCQAFMEETPGNNRFGLEVICYRSDRKLPEATNYRHRVGASLKPKLVRPGRIIVRLRSQMFEADVEAGEDESMLKEEPDFRGRDFEKQYCCKFKREGAVERGTFGKVIVERKVNNNVDPIFEFNLHKTGVETEASPSTGERWTVIAMKELAGSLQILDGSNWKKFAQHIGFTKNEIKSKLQYSDDPFLAMMNMYSGRGGTPEEFTQALYAVSRELRINEAGMSGMHSEGSSSPTGSRESDSRASSSRSSGQKVKKKFFWNFRPWAAINNDSDSDNNGNSPKAKKRSHASNADNSKGSKNEGSAQKKKKLSEHSDCADSEGSGSDKEDEKASRSKSLSTEKHKHNTRKLTDKDLWKISSKIVRRDWRNLGRSLGIEEQVLLNLEHSHQATGFRECAYQMLLEWKGRMPKKCTFGFLYTALLNEDMVAVAKFMVRQVGTESKADSP